MKKLTWLVILAIPLFAFKPKSVPYTVRTYGTFSGAKAGDHSIKIDLDSVKVKKHDFGIGLSAEDNGIIMIWKGKVFKSAPDTSGLIVTRKKKDAKASFLILGRVKKWEDYILPSTIRSVQDLETEIEKIVSNLGLDLSKPLPIILQGSPISANWYIFPSEGSDKTISDYSGFFFENKVRAIGYYTGTQQGILTSSQTKLHIHVTDRSKEVIGHLDDIKMAGGMKLLLPKVETIKKRKKSEKKSKRNR